MKEKGQFKKKFVKKIATIMMAAAMAVSAAPAAFAAERADSETICNR